MYHVYFMGKNEIDILDELESAFDEYACQGRIKYLFKHGKHPVLEQGLMYKLNHELSGDELIYSFTDKGLNYFFGADKKNILSESGTKIIEHLPHHKILPQSLFFSGKNEEQLNQVKKILTPGIFETAQQRMQDELKKSSTGICIILHGEPGTGKTEFVLQLARETNRNIYKVDVPQIKNMFYGESEKRVKNIFTDYYSVSNGQSTPILFINEADSLLSKRIEVSRSVDQTGNAIQNILLDEMERFNGIMIVTTNLVNNFDAAFERRFLMKIKFEKATQEQQKLIWKNKIPRINDTEISHLISNYNLSPGQIDNVSKKAFLNQIIEGESKFTDIINFCGEESFHDTSKTSIGFRN